MAVKKIQQEQLDPSIDFGDPSQLTDGTTSLAPNLANLGAGFMLIKGQMNEAGFLAEGGFSVYARGGADGLTGNWDNYINLQESGGIALHVNGADTAGEGRVTLNTLDGVRIRSAGGGLVDLKTTNTTTLRTLEMPDADGTIATQEYVTANAGGGGGVTAQEIREETYNYSTGANVSTTAPQANMLTGYELEADAIANAKYRTRPFIFYMGEIPTSVGSNQTATASNFNRYFKVKTADGSVVNAYPEVGDIVTVIRNSTYANRLQSIKINNDSTLNYKTSSYSTIVETSNWLQNGSVQTLIMQVAKDTNAGHAIIPLGNTYTLTTTDVSTSNNTTGVVTSAVLFSAMNTWANLVSGTTHLLVSGKRVRRNLTATTLNTGNLTISTNTNVSNDYHIILSASATAPRQASITSLTTGLAVAPSDEINFIFENLNTTHDMTLLWNAMWKTPSGITLPASIPAGATVFMTFYYLNATSGWVLKSITGTGY